MQLLKNDFVTCCSLDRLPESLIIAETPIIAKWDSNTLQWRTGGIQLESFDKNENFIVFNTSVFGNMAIFQDYHINMPFQLSYYFIVYFDF